MPPVIYPLVGVTLAGPDNTRVVLGGQAFSGNGQVQALGADGYSSRASELMPLAHRLVGAQ